MATTESDIKLLRLRVKLMESIATSTRQLNFEAQSQATVLYDKIGGLNVGKDESVVLIADLYQKIALYLRCMSRDAIHELPDRGYLRAYYDKIASDKDILNQL